MSVDLDSNIEVGAGANAEQAQTQTQSLTNTNSSSSTSSASSNSSSDVSLAGGTQSININNPDDLRIRNVASPDTPNPYPTAPCRIGVSAGLSLAGGALSGGGSVEDEECTLRETARSFKDLGVPEMGLYLLCTQSEVVVGKRDKKGELEDGENPLGAERCMDMVTAYLESSDSGEDSADARESVKAANEEIESLERELAVAQETSQQALMQVDELRDLVERTRGQAKTVYQEYLSDKKRAALASVLEEDDQ